MASISKFSKVTVPDLDLNEDKLKNKRLNWRFAGIPAGGTTNSKGDTR